MMSEHQKGRTEGLKVWINTINSPSLEFPKLCMIAEAKCIVLSNVINIYRGKNVLIVL